MINQGKLFTRLWVVFLTLALLALPSGGADARRWMLADQRVWNVLRTCTDGVIVLMVHEASSDPAFVPDETSPAWVELGVRKITNPNAPLPGIDGYLTVPPTNYNPAALVSFQRREISYHPNPLAVDHNDLGFANSYYYYSFLELRWTGTLAAGTDRVIVVGGKLNQPNVYTGMVSSVENCRVSQFQFGQDPSVQFNSSRFAPTAPELRANLPLNRVGGIGLGSINVTGSPVSDRFSQQDINTGLVTYTAAAPRLESDLLSLRSVDVVRASLVSNGLEAGGQSYAPRISRTGRYVVFMSSAYNLPGGDGVTFQAYLRDRDWDQNGIFDEPGGTSTVLVSSQLSGAGSGSIGSWGGDISGNGRWAVFYTPDSNIVANDNNADQDVFARSTTGGTVRVSVATNGVEANGSSMGPAISETGRYVVFSSTATNLVPNIPDANGRVYLRDRDTDNNGVFDEAGKVATLLISKTSTGTPSDGFSGSPSISANGRYVVYGSSATNLAPGDGNGLSDIFLFDRQTQKTERVSLAFDGTDPNGQSFLGSSHAVSDDGRFVVYYSFADNITPISPLVDGNGKTDVFVRDRNAQQNRLISYNRDKAFSAVADSDSPSISGDGRRIAFTSGAYDLIPFYTRSCSSGGIEYDCRDIYVYDQDSNDMILVSRNTDEQQGNGDSGSPTISGNGRFIAFDSNATNLVTDDNNFAADIFAAYAGFPFSFPILAREQIYLPTVRR